AALMRRGGPGSQDDADANRALAPRSTKRDKERSASEASGGAHESAPPEHGLVWISRSGRCPRTHSCVQLRIAHRSTWTVSGCSPTNRLLILLHSAAKAGSRANSGCPCT